MHQLDSNLAITPQVCRDLMGKGADVGPHARTILLKTKVAEGPISNLEKAEVDAQVK